MNAAGVPERPVSFLRDCLVGGDSTQEARVRRSKRRALLISIVVQILIVTALVLFPLFTKGENIASRAIFVPAIPYSPGHPHDPGKPAAQPPHGHPTACHFCAPPSIPPTIVIHDESRIGDSVG
ncbi:MAG: hypothetical protein WBW90_26740, partial [Candidatus Acidiferrum sp.]